MAFTRVVFSGVLCFGLIFIASATATQMECPEINENSTFGELNMAWNCDMMRWRDALAGLKKRVEQQCNVTDQDEYWRAVYECPDFSEISCTDDTPILNETDSFNCTISYCKSGNYSDDVFLLKIWLHHFITNKKFMDAYRSNLTHCLQSAGSTIDVYMTQCPDVDVNSTATEMSVAWMCELINWRNILAEWKQAVEEDCSVNASQPEWQATFQCPNFSEVECTEEQPFENSTDSLNCSINYCSSGEYTDTTILQIISGAQIDAYESAISITSSNVTCKPRENSDVLSTTQLADDSIASSTAGSATATNAANEMSTKPTEITVQTVSTVDDEDTTDIATTMKTESTPILPTIKADVITSAVPSESTTAGVGSPFASTTEPASAVPSLVTSVSGTSPASFVATTESTSSRTESETATDATIFSDGSGTETTIGLVTTEDLTTSNMEQNLITTEVRGSTPDGFQSTVAATLASTDTATSADAPAPPT